MKSYSIHYFGLLVERRGLAVEKLESTARTPAELYAQLDAVYQLGLSTANFRAAVNDEFVPWDHPLSLGDHIAFLPPMSGG